MSATLRTAFPFERGARLLRLLLPALLLCGASARALDPATDLGQFSRSAWQTENGLPQNTVHAVTQTRDGSIWVGTSSGLSRFKDGSFTSFTARDGLAGDSVQALAEDAEGAHWVGTSDGLSRFKDGKFESPAGAEGFAGGGVAAVERDARGRVWLGTPDGLACYHEGLFVSYTTADALPDNRVTSLEADREGGLWVGTESGGLHQLRGKKFTTYTTREGLSSDLVKAIYEDRAGGRRIPGVVAERLAGRMGGSDLTGGELEVLEQIVRGGSNREIAAALGISEATVKSHINNILSKLDAADRTQAATKALQRGIVHLP